MLSRPAPGSPVSEILNSCMRAFPLVWFLLVASSSLSEAPGRRDVLRTGFRSNELLVVYGAGDPAQEARLKESAGSLTRWRANSVRLVSATTVEREALTRGPVVLIGTASSNRWIDAMAPALPVGFQDGGFRFSGKSYLSPGDSIQLLYPNPWCPDAPLFLIAGNTDDAVLDALDRRRRDDIQIRRNGKTLLLGRFRDDWTLDPERLEEFGWPDRPDLASRSFEYFAPDIRRSELEEFARENETARDRIEKWFGPVREKRRTAIYVYKSLERKGLAIENTEPAQAESEWGALHVVLGIDRSPERLAAQALLESVLPRDLPPVLARGLATVLVEDDETLNELDRIARGLLRTTDPPGLDSSDGESPLAVEAVSASFARFLLAERGRGAFRTKLELAPLGERWHAALQERSFGPAPFPDPPPSFQRGFTYAQEGFDIRNGYLSSTSDRSLEKLARLGVDSIAIVPYAFVNDPSGGGLSIPRGPGAETDEGVTHVLRAGKEKGMTVLLKPQIWVRRGWPGEIKPGSAHDEDRFFNEYGRWMLHYALIAEENQVPILSIGCELARLTHGYRARWESLIRDLRAVYRGKLVYSANWGEEVEQVDFWPLLDYIGVDFYYPLSTEDSPSDESLRRGIGQALARLHALAKRERKPVLLTEIGYASTRSPWKSPHSSDRYLVDEPSPEAQARLYDLAFTAIAEQTSWIRGMYWWKWPSDPDRGGLVDFGFTPKGKPAEEVVRRWYRGRIQ